MVISRPIPSSEELLKSLVYGPSGVDHYARLQNMMADNGMISKYQADQIEKSSGTQIDPYSEKPVVVPNVVEPPNKSISWGKAQELTRQRNEELKRLKEQMKVQTTTRRTSFGD